MKRLLFLVAVIIWLTIPAEALDLPEDLEHALPEEAESILELEDLNGPTDFHTCVNEILQNGLHRFKGIFYQKLRGAIQVLLVVLLCGAVDGAFSACKSKAAPFLPMAATLSITTLTVGNMQYLLGLGEETIRKLSDFSSVLLPSLAMASAAAGGVTSATTRQVITLFAIELLVKMIDQLLLPLTFLYVALLTAGGCLSENRLELLAEGVKKLITWMLCASLLVFTGYMSTVRIISGTADGTSVKLAKAAISSVVPVVGGIISEATEAVLSGAGILRNTIGILGILAILSVCLLPFFQLGIQYILYKLVAFLSSVIGTPGICKLVNGLASAFGLVLGMTGSCALLLLISILSFAAGVIP